ncbi:MAG: acetyl-CoA carboxylase biotin carboxyl carrier protein [Betaproteobacteria bacterium]|nr:acetyl-CoA carboxylase biotin carboxyl carrier protein [Betaproteobacteria bacterium]
MTEVKPEDVEALVEIFDQSDWSELRIASSNFQLYLSKDAAQRDRHRVAVPASATPAMSSQRAAGSLSVQQMQHATAASPHAAASADAAIPDGMQAVRAPSLGTFYLAPKPGAAPFVTVGQRVEPETEICIIEVMKLFTAVRAGTRGIVRRILAADAQMVEFDQPLILIEPAD